MDRLPAEVWSQILSNTSLEFEVSAVQNLCLFCKLCCTHAQAYLHSNMDLAGYHPSMSQALQPFSKRSGEMIRKVDIASEVFIKAKTNVDPSYGEEKDIDRKYELNIFHNQLAMQDDFDMLALGPFLAKLRCWFRVNCDSYTQDPRLHNLVLIRSTANLLSLPSIGSLRHLHLHQSYKGKRSFASLGVFLSATSTVRTLEL